MCGICPLSSAIGSFCFLRWAEGLEVTKDEEFVPSPQPGILYQTACVCVYVCVCFNECACHAIHCQDFDRFLFVHKLLSVISSIFETIKQRRENGWLGNPWILICQQNENESGRWWKCAEWEVAADMSKEQTSSSFGHFRSRLFSSAACPGARNGMRLTARGLKLQRI